MLQGLGIRGKILAVVAVPLLVLMLAATYITFTAATYYQDSNNANSVVTAVGRAQDATAALQIERNASINFVMSIRDKRLKLALARIETDARLVTLQQALAQDPSQHARDMEALLSTAVGVGSAEGFMGSARALEISDPESAAQWLQFPTQDELTRMRSDYTDAYAALDAAADLEPEGSPLRVPMAGLAVQLQEEAGFAYTLFTEPVPYQATLDSNFAVVDAALTELASAVAQIEPTPENAQTIEALEYGVVISQGIAEIRNQVRTGDASDVTLLFFYTEGIETLLRSAADIVTVIPNSDLVADVQAFAAIDTLVEAIRYETVYAEIIVRRGEFLSGEADAFRAAKVETDLALESAQQRAQSVPGFGAVPPFGASTEGEPGSQVSFNSIRLNLISGRLESLTQAADRDWSGKAETEVAAYTPLRDELWSDISNDTKQDTRTAATRVFVTGGIVLAALVSSFIIALLIARRIVNPLRRLTTTATAVRQELPRLVERVAMPGVTVDVSEVQIPVESRDEVGRLAEAFNSVNAATLAVAAEQAALRGSISEMFVNVARRDQVLLNRQLASIDDMERTQDDPDTLTKLFALDHLATRMRRNAESLLVLAGIDTGRRLRRPMPLSDVIRTASSEIELYERVQLELDADPAMLGHSALTAAHLFAELLENATVFSDPGSPVTVRTGFDGTNFVVTITDSGIGMTIEELAEANSRVTTTAASEILGAQRLGLFVVGRIARRVGARVHLDSEEAKGTVATVTMPPSLFDSSTPLEETEHRSESATDGSIHAPAALVQGRSESEVFVGAGTGLAYEAPAADANVGQGSRPAAGSQAYQPTVIADGPSLAGRDPLYADASASPASAEVQRLVESDAASAPSAREVDLDELTDGVTATGLPTRRRKGLGASEGPETPVRTNSILGLPVRASDEQLSALANMTTPGFTPILAADEVSPESAEERSKMFRGFRTRRANELDAEAATLPGESVGQAVRRGAPLEAVLAEDSLADSEAAYEGEYAFSGAAGSSGVAEASHGSRGSAAFGQDPLISAGYDHAADAPTAGFPAGGFVVPLLEEDPEPPAVAHVSAPEQQEVVPEEAWGAPVPSGQAQMPAQVVSQEPPTASAPFRSPLYPSAPRWDQGEPAVAGNGYGEQASPFASSAPQQAPFAQGQAPTQFPAAQAPSVFSSPSLDELIIEGGSEAYEDKSGFFSKLFGKPKRPEPVVRATPEGQIGSALSDGVPVSFGTASLPVPVVSNPWTTENEILGTGPVASGAVPMVASPYAPQQQAAPVSPAMGFPEAPHAPYAPQSAPAYQSPFATTSGSFDQLIAPSAPATQAPAPAVQAPVQEPSWAQAWPAQAAPSQFAASGGQQYQSPVAGSEYEFPDAGKAYSPDQLARPLGWEAAGASALQAAAPDVATEYRPVVQIEPQPFAEGETDLASAVFSELSSLAIERPKVERTRTGLTKRTPVAVEEAVEAPVASSQSPRDADAVRQRFLNFYSGTKRARNDVASQQASGGGFPTP